MVAVARKGFGSECPEAPLAVINLCCPGVPDSPFLLQSLQSQLDKGGKWGESLEAFTSTCKPCSVGRVILKFLGLLLAWMMEYN